MKKVAKQSWVPLRDYLVGGVRPAKKAPQPVRDPSLPATWVSAWDYWVQGVRKPPAIDERTTIVALKPVPPAPPPVAELWLTEEDVIADIQAIFARSLVPMKVEEMRYANQQERVRGEIADEEWQYREARLEEMQEEHFVRLEEIVQWYVDNYFREFETEMAT
ncbi:MAG: hypothetical protein HQL88_07850, partial [Magnetococcales bacterium]|nr:hypothetical protein [Magnetococcales bacterium]